MVLSTPDGLPRGLVVGADASFMGPASLRGCGLYSGGDVRGRQWVTLTAPTPAPSAAATSDLAYGGLYSQAGVHAAGRIFSDGVEEHAGADAPAADSDADSGVAPPADLVAAPRLVVVGDLAAHASEPFAALGPSGLDLALLDHAGPSAVGGPCCRPAVAST